MKEKAQRVNLKAMLFGVLQIIRGGEVGARFYREALHWQHGDVQPLKVLLEHATKHVPYYRDLHIEPAEPLQWLSRFPVLTKDIIRKEFERLKSDDIHARRWLLNSSGGSTGQPVQLVQDIPSGEWSTSAEAYFYKKMLGLDMYDARKVFLWGSERDIFKGRKFTTRLAHWLANIILLNSFSMTNADMLHHVQTINSIKPTVLKGYAGSLYELSRFIRHANLPIHHPAVVYSSAETLQPFMRESIEQVFGTKVFDFYGSREVGAIAGECRLGSMHLFDCNVNVEVVDHQNMPVSVGQEGELLITTLHNFAMPLIRYRIGDTAVVGKPCTCGIDGPTIVGVTGRITDHFLTKDGTIVHGEYFTHLFYFRPWVREFQIRQTELDLVDIFYVPNATVPAADVAEINSKVRLVMGKDCRVEWKTVDEIPRTPQGKMLYTYSAVKRQPDAKAAGTLAEPLEKQVVLRGVEQHDDIAVLEAMGSWTATADKDHTPPAIAAKSCGAQREFGTMKIAIHDRPGSFSDRWKEYCALNNITFKPVSCYSNDIVRQLEDVQGLLWHWTQISGVDIMMARHVLTTAELEMGLKVFPNQATCWHFDDKIAQKYLLEAIGVPFVPTFVFYDAQSAFDWIDRMEFPKVFKLRRGAGSLNVQLVRSKHQARALTRKAFGGGFRVAGKLFDDFATKVAKARRRREIIGTIQRLPSTLKSIWRANAAIGRERGYVYFQDFMPNNTNDTRVTVIGDRAFAFTRDVRKNDFRASGSGCIVYDLNRIDLQTVRIALDVQQKLNLQSVAFDFVKDAQGQPRIVEISYAYIPKAVYDCSGYWDRQLNWHEGHIWPQDAILIDLIESIRASGGGI